MINKTNGKAKNKANWKLLVFILLKKVTKKRKFKAVIRSIGNMPIVQYHAIIDESCLSIYTP